MLKEGVRPEYLHHDVLKKGSLKERPDLLIPHHLGDHRVFQFEDDGRFFIEIFLEIKKQIFVSELLNKLGIYASKIYKYVDDKGKEIFVSEVPKPEDYNYRFAKGAFGLSQMALLSILFDDYDHNVRKSFEDTKFGNSNKNQNLNLVLGNFVFYDFNEAELEFLSREFTISNISRDMDFFYNIAEKMFSDGRMVEYSNIEDFMFKFQIYCFSKLHEIEKLLRENGVEIVSEILKSKNLKNIPGLEDLSANEFVTLLLKRIEVAEKYFFEKLGAENKQD